MKVGSLVECVSGKRKASDIITQQRIDEGIIKLPYIGGIYTVRAFTPRCIGILLEEIINPKVETNEGYIEQGFDIKNFKEIQPPQDLTEILEYQHPKHLLIT